MTFNENKYSVLSNMQHAWFFQRVEGGQTLRHYGPTCELAKYAQSIYGNHFACQ